MSLGPVLDVAIGLIFTYLLLGLLATGVQEFVSGAVKLRGRKLRDGVEHLLAGKGGNGQPDRGLFTAVYEHSLVEGLASSKLPSYIPSRNFSLALFHALADGSGAPLFQQIQNGIARLPDGHAKTALTMFLADAGEDLDKLKAHVETWFDDAMDRVSGMYKRWTHYFSLGLGLVLAVGMNVDSINIAYTLWLHPDQRAVIVTAATQYSAASPLPAPDDVVKRAQVTEAQLEALPIPIGWTRRQGEPPGMTAWQRLREHVTAPEGKGIWAVFGWVLTAFAVSLGAPFWFDTLQRALNLRNAGPKPPRSDEQT